jgi:hypothetical protein
LEFEAIVAVIAQVPVPDVIDTTPEAFTEHAVDAPSDHVTAPAVDPPDADNETVVPYAPVAVPEIVNAD